MFSKKAIATISSNVANIEFDVKWDLFIIPNRYSPISSQSSNSAKRIINGFMKLAELNNEEYNPDARIIQVWYTNEDCENGVCHHPYVEDENGQRYYISFLTSEYLPSTVICGMKENEPVQMKIPVRLYQDRLDKNKGSFDAIMNCTLTPAQLKYRYGDCGKFEDVAKALAK